MDRQDHKSTSNGLNISKKNRGGYSGLKFPFLEHQDTNDLRTYNEGTIHDALRTKTRVKVRQCIISTTAAAGSGICQCEVAATDATSCRMVQQD